MSLFSSTTADDGHGSDDIHRLDLRSSASERAAGEGGASADAARHRRGQEERTIGLIPARSLCFHLFLLLRTSACRTKRNNTRFTIKRWQSQWYASRLTALILLPPVSSKNGERSTDVPTRSYLSPKASLFHFRNAEQMLLLTCRTSNRIIGSYTGFLGSFSIERGSDS